MFQFNSKKLVVLCRKLILMIEDNQIAEELSDKIKGIQNRYQSKVEADNLYRFRVRDAIQIWHANHPEEDKIKTEERFDSINGIWWFMLTNKHYHMYMKFADCNIMGFSYHQENSYMPEKFYRWVFELISD
jgi:hypothetical protein